MDEDFTFEPGQYVDLLIDTSEESVATGFSITSSPLEKRVLSIGVKSIPSARAAMYLHQNAKVGDTFNAVGPGGEFFYRREMGDSLVLIAGGIGITPFMSIVKYAQEAKLEVEITLLYSAKTPAELAFSEDLRAISAQSPNIKCFFTVTQPQGEQWEGRVGRIDADMLREHAARSESIFFVCGPGEMPQQISETLRELGVENSRINAERW
jgi:ferredoxin-NADP reductase